MPLDPHMNGDMFMWYQKECLLKRKQILVHVSDPSKKLATRVKIQLLGSQRVEH